MLIIAVRLHLEWQRPSVHLHAEHLRAQAECRRELDPAIACPSSFGRKLNAASGLAILKVHCDSADVDIANRKRHPVRWHVRSETNLMFFRIGLQTEQATQDRADDHGR